MPSSFSPLLRFWSAALLLLRIRSGKRFTLGFAISALFLTLSEAAFAFVPVPKVVFPQTRVGNTVTLGALTADASNAAAFSFGAISNGNLFANAVESLPTAGGASVDLAVAGHIPMSTVGAALGRFAERVTPAIQIGFAVYQLAKDLGFLTTTNPDGTVSWQQNDPSVCTVAPCMQYEGASPAGHVDGLWFNSVAAACADSASFSGTAAGGYPGHAIAVETVGTNSCRLSYDGQDWVTLYLDGRSVAPASGPSFLPATPQDFGIAVAQKSSWTSDQTSTLDQAVTDAVSNGEAMPVTPDTITGPATVTQPAESTNDGTNTVTKTATDSLTYNGPSVTDQPSVQSVTVNNATNQVTNTTNTTNSSPAPQQPQTCGLPGTPPCKIDESGTLDPSQLDQGWDQQQQIDTQGKGNQTAVTATGDKGFFNSWTSFFITPQLVSCSPFQLPTFLNQNLGAVDPCPAVEYGRGLAGLIWALSGFWLCIGMVRGVL